MTTPDEIKAALFDEPDDISHHGILGMKWGVRNAETLAKYAGPKGRGGASDAELKKAYGDLPEGTKAAVKKAHGKAKAVAETDTYGENDGGKAWKSYVAEQNRVMKQADKDGLTPEQKEKLKKALLVTAGVALAAGMAYNAGVIGPHGVDLKAMKTVADDLGEGFGAALKNQAGMQDTMLKCQGEYTLRCQQAYTAKIDPTKLSTEGVNISADTVLHRVGRGMNVGDGVRLHDGVGCKFVSYLPQDNDTYAAMFPFFKSNKSANRMESFQQAKMTLSEPLKGPSAKERYETFRDLLADPSPRGVAVRQDLIDCGLVRAPFGNAQAHQIMRSTPDRIAPGTYRLWAAHSQGHKTGGMNAYFQALADKGFNCVTDDNDTGVLAEHALIVFKDVCKVTEVTEMNPKTNLWANHKVTLPTGDAKALRHDILEDGDYLAHHGVLGMRWGVWNAETRAKYMGSGGHGGAPKTLKRGGTGASGGASYSKRTIKAVKRSAKMNKQLEGVMREGGDTREAQKIADKLAKENKIATDGIRDAMNQQMGHKGLTEEQKRKLKIAAGVTLGVAAAAAVGTAVYLNRDAVAAHIRDPQALSKLWGMDMQHNTNYGIRAKQMAKLDVDALPDVDTVVGKDQKCYRMARHDFITRDPNTGIMGTFISTNEADRDRYGVLYPHFGEKHDYSPYNELTLSLKEDLKIPSAKKRFETYVEMLGEDSVHGAQCRKDTLAHMPKSQRMWHSDEDWDKLMRSNPQEVAKGTYQSWVNKAQGAKLPSAGEYYQRFLSKGYNAIVDDNDGNACSELPVIVIKDNIMSISGKREIDPGGQAYGEMARRMTPYKRDKNGPAIKHEDEYSVVYNALFC